MNPYYVISLSGAYEDQSFWKKDKEEGKAQFLDCTDVSGSLYFCSDEAGECLRNCLKDIPVNALRFIDSGDYHYLSLFFLERIRTPFGLLLFDHHSDCMESAFGGGLLTFGSWVLRALSSLPYLKKAILVGPADEDRTGEQLLKDPRITWVQESEFEQKKKELCEELLIYPVYISLDKDVLDTQEAVTDWSQGTMRLDGIFSFLREAKNCGVQFLGMDVCGEQDKKADLSGAGHSAQINSLANGKILYLALSNLSCH